MITTSVDPRGSRGADVELAALSAILVHGPVSRTELATRLSLSQSTMTRAVKPLLDRGLVQESSEALEGPGRPSRPLSGVPGGRKYVGAKLTGDEVIAVVTDMLAHELSSKSGALDTHDPERVADVTAGLIRELIDPGELAYVGLSLGGSAVDGRTVDRAPFLGWRGTPLASMLESRLGVPVVIDNDVSALTAGEHWFGAARGLDDFAVVTIGAGVGLGLVRHGQVIRTRDSGLGLAGHIPLEGHGIPCAAGHRGCATAVLSIPSLEAQATVALRRPTAFEEILDLAREGDRACAEIVDGAARALGRLLALVADLAMVDVVVVGGDGIALLDAAEHDVRRQLRQDRDPEAHELELRIDHSDFTRWARGAATVAIQASLRGLLEDAAR